MDTITDETGNVIARMSFDAFGQRRVAADWNEGFPFSTELDAIRDITTRGYTDHQMVDSVNLIHMNGRIYDPELGRFLSADPFIPHPFNTQSFNRYSYVRNNPLTLVDPSGFVDEEPVCPEATCTTLPGYWTGPVEGGGGGEVWRTPDSFCGNCGGGGGRTNSNAARLPTLPEGLVNFSAGLGDGILLGYGDDLRESFGVDGGVDPLSTEYGVGYATGFAETAILGVALGLQGALAQFFGPSGPVFGDTAFGAVHQGILNVGRLGGWLPRIGWGRFGGGAQFRIGVRGWKQNIGRPIRKP